METTIEEIKKYAPVEQMIDTLLDNYRFNDIDNDVKLSNLYHALIQFKSGLNGLSVFETEDTEIQNSIEKYLKIPHN